MTAKKVYPKHIYEPIRIEVATSYIKHEFRKLLSNVPEKYFNAIDDDISDWTKSSQLTYPRDFWNGFHGICMGFKLKIGLTYLITAENIKWRKGSLSLNKLWFGVEHKETKTIRDGKLSAKEVVKFYSLKENQPLKKKFVKLNQKLSKETSLRDNDPIIAFEKIEDDKLVYSVHDGNRRLAKAALNSDKVILTYIGTYTTKKKIPHNFWVPTTILMENLLFAKLAYDKNNKKMFRHYMSTIKDLLTYSESAVYEMKERALTNKQPFRSDVLKALNLPS